VELTIATGLLGCRYGIADLVSGKNSNGDIVHAFRSRHWPLSMRMAFASQIRWRVRAALTVGDVGYALDLVKFSCRAFGLSATGGSFKFPFFSSSAQPSGKGGIEHLGSQILMGASKCWIGLIAAASKRSRLMVNSAPS
jgi:hypothetical protein